MVVGDMDIDTEPAAAANADVEMEELASSSSNRRRHSTRRHSQRSHTKNDESEVEEEGEEEKEHLPSALIPNTVDFALREKEEMRDLTKASQIISLFPRPTTSPLSGSPVTALLPASSSSAIAAPHHHHYPGFGPQQQPLHLQHLQGLIPPSPSSSSSGRYRQQQPQQHHPFQLQTSQQHPVQVEYAFTHPDPGVDISSPATFFDPRVGHVFLGNAGATTSPPVKGTEKGQDEVEDEEEKE
jgi:dual specificity MAP kinase phosphatase